MNVSQLLCQKIKKPPSIWFRKTSLPEKARTYTQFRVSGMLDTWISVQNILGYSFIPAVTPVYPVLDTNTNILPDWVPQTKQYELDNLVAVQTIYGVLVKTAID
jgi:hypothetical protein